MTINRDLLDTLNAAVRQHIVYNTNLADDMLASICRAEASMREGFKEIVGRKIRFICDGISVTGKVDNIAYRRVILIQEPQISMTIPVVRVNGKNYAYNEMVGTRIIE